MGLLDAPLVYWPFGSCRFHPVIEERFQVPSVVGAEQDDGYEPQNYLGVSESGVGPFKTHGFVNGLRCVGGFDEVVSKLSFAQHLPELLRAERYRACVESVENIVEHVAASVGDYRAANVSVQKIPVNSGTEGMRSGGSNGTSEVLAGRRFLHIACGSCGCIPSRFCLAKLGLFSKLPNQSAAPNPA